MEKTIMTIEGMSCAHCVAAVTSALEGFDSVKDVQVSLEKNEASFAYDPAIVAFSVLKEAVEDQGYDVVE